MQKKISAFEIALSAIACAFSTLFMSLGVLNDFLLATGYVAGCFALMLPLSKGFIVGDVLAYAATVLLTFLFGGIAVPWRVLPFVLFFGLHPLLNHLELRFRWNKILLLAVKVVWFDVTAYLVWRFLFGMTTSFDWVDEYILPVIAVGGSLFFVAYDFCIFRCQCAVDKLIARIDKK